VRLLTPTHAERELHAVTFLQPLGNGAKLRFKIMRIGFGAHTHLLHHDRLLILARFAFSPGLLVLLAPEVEDPADRRLGIWLDLNKIQITLPSHPQGIHERHLPQSRAIRIDNKDHSSANLFVDADLVTRSAAILGRPHRLPL
jgi:hypothetical protein